MEKLLKLNGGRSSVGRALDCDSSGRGFKPLRSPQFLLLPTKYTIKSYLFFLSAGVVQLDRASDFESECWEFESLRPHQQYQRITLIYYFINLIIAPLLCHFNVRTYWYERQSGHR